MFSISNIPTYLLSRTTHQTFVKNTTPLNIVRNELKSKVYFYTYNGLFLNQNNLFNSMNYVESDYVLFKIFYNDIENIKSFPKWGIYTRPYKFPKLINMSMCVIWSLLWIYPVEFTVIDHLCLYLKELEQIMFTLYKILKCNVGDLTFILSRYEVQWNINNYPFCFSLWTACN